MKLLRGGLLVGVSLASLAVVPPTALAAAASAADPDGMPQLLTELQFKSAVPMATTASAASTASMAASTTSIGSAAGGAPHWAFGAQKGGSIGVQATTSPVASTGVYALEGTYPNPPSGGQYIWASYNVTALETEDVYIEFWAKMPGAKEGSKFVKVFGQPSTSGAGADTTIATNYTGGDYGAIYQISFGDGTTLANDSQNVINLNGKYPQWIGRSFGTAVVQTPQMHDFSSADWGTGWHHFRIHVKFNSGTTASNEVPNGEYYLEIDGKVYVDATGLYNRNPGDPPISQIEFFGWAQSEPQPFALWYDDIRISTGGFLTQEPPPDSPSNVAVK
jgi:hypothetical protein